MEAATETKGVAGRGGGELWASAAATWAIARREVSTYFNSPIAYIVVSVFLLISGWLYFSAVFLIGLSSLRNFFAITPVLLVVFAPAISMRLIAEERKSGTLELLTTMPVQDVEVILGKFLAALAVVGTGLLLTLAYPITVDAIGTLDWGPVAGGYVGLVMLSAALLALGLMTSAMSENQIVAFILGLLLCFAFYLVDKVTFFLPTALAPLLEYLSVDYHFRNVSRGVIDTRDVVYYVSLTAAALVLSVRALARRHG